MVLLICYPGEIYRGMPEADVAEAYNKLAMLEYDDAIRFWEVYQPFKDKPEFTCEMKKSGETLLMTAFLDQPASGFGKVKKNFLTSSYLFNITRNGLVLPDLDVVSITSINTPVSRDIVDEVEALYKKHSWTTARHPNPTNSGDRVNVEHQHPERLSQLKNIQMISIDTLVKVAKRHGYSQDKLYFDIEAK